MFSDVDASIRQLLVQKMPLDPGEIDIAFKMPDRDWSNTLSKPTINIYLYDIHENHDLRDYDWIVTREAGIATKTTPPIRVDLSYLITIWTSDVTDEHRLLGSILSTLYRYPELPEEVLQNSLKIIEWRIKSQTAQPDGILQNVADFWSALDNQLKPSINYVVTVPIDIDVQQTAPEVRTRELRFENKTRIGTVEDFILVSGIVHREGDYDSVVPDARVLLKEVQLSATSDRDGVYLFPRLSPGKYTVVVSAPGERAKEMIFGVPGENYDIEI
ncbi:MAG TPA: DUF4255 domain-containing protein [Dehalococcoidia bacterium]|nr:DUF4255 domain-containing protein [Dehalococcoidia bacterium]